MLFFRVCATISVFVWKLLDHSLQIGFGVRYANRFDVCILCSLCAKTLIALKWLDVDINKVHDFCWCVFVYQWRKMVNKQTWMIHWSGPMFNVVSVRFDYVPWMKFTRTSRNRKGQPLISIALDSQATFFCWTFQTLTQYESFDAIDFDRERDTKLWTLLVLIKNINRTLFFSPLIVVNVWND